jgi:SAM-dependent methyltransferase/uncharacterized protein YbaR (Trm112 family)
MRRALLDVLRAPRTLAPLTLDVTASRPLPGGDEDVVRGILRTRNGTSIFPVVDGVPVMLSSPATERMVAVLQRRGAGADGDMPRHGAEWSFSHEWRHHTEHDVAEHPGGWSVEDRLKQFFIETGTDPEWCRGKFILDAGCGTGQLVEAVAGLGATAVGLDYSTSVFDAERRRKSPDAHFVQADLRTPPFDRESFDVATSVGVLHHTPSTYESFVAVAKLVKPGGRFFVWLYRRPERFFRRHITWPALDMFRTVVSRLPDRPQATVVHAYTRGLRLAHRLRHLHQDVPWDAMVVRAYDSITPRWKHYHTPFEVSHWFFLNGFSSPAMTHWDNPYGFGMVAVKQPLADTPGHNFGKTDVIRRFWQ